MREGYYTDAYFNHTRAALLADGRHPRVLMQVFQRRRAMLGGMDEAIAILKLCSHDWDALDVSALNDGDTIEPWETVMTIEGDYTLFAHLETVYLGVLARRTLISTNTERVLRAANGKPIIFMPARHDHHRVQTGDGYAAYVAGAMSGTEIGVTSDAQASWWGGRGVGTVPHSLIAAYDGDTVLAAKKFAEWAPPDLHITVLVDFENDSVATALAVAEALGPKLWGVRLDTSGQLVDRSLWEEMGDFDPRGVNERLVRKVRAALDDAGHDGRPHRRVRRVLRGEDRGVRAPRRSGRRVRRRLLPDPRRERLHRRHRRRRRQAELQGRPSSPSEPPARACPRRPDPLGRRHAGRLRPPGRQARRSRRRGRGPRDVAARRVGAGARHRARRFGRRPRADRSRDLGSARLREHVSAPLPSRHARRRADPRDGAGRPAPALARRLPAGPRPRAHRRAQRDPAAEEELRRVHQPERGGGARGARSLGGRRLRRRDGCVRPRGDRRPASPRPPCRVRRGCVTRPRRGADAIVPCAVARGRGAVHDERRASRRGV